MKVLFLGTGAGEFYPAMLCRCPECRRCRSEGRIFGFSSIIIDDRILIDAPPGTAMNFAAFKVEPAFPFHIFITHSHPDHFDPAETASPRMSPEDEVTIHLNRTTAGLLEHYKKFNRFYDLQNAAFRNVNVNVLEPFQPIAVAGYGEVMPVAARHDRTHGEQCLNFIVQGNGGTLLYAADTGFYDDRRTWAEVLRRRYDIVVMEYSFRRVNDTHLDYDAFRRFMDRLAGQDCLHDGTQIIATHLHLHQIDRRQLEALEKAGVKIAFRGMRCDSNKGNGSNGHSC